MGAVSAHVRAFFLRGNVAGLTVAVAVGYAFVAFAQTFVDGLLLPLVMSILSDSPAEALSFAVGDDGEIYYGYVIGAFVAFALVAAAAYLLVVVPVNRYVARRRADEEPVA